MPNGVAAVVRGGRILSIPMALAASLALAATAGAVTRYASPDGVPGPSCPQANPCNIQVAVESAAANDEVIVTPGTYVETNQLEPFAAGVNIHGAPGTSKPTIQTSATNGVVLSGSDQRIADLRIEHDNFGNALVISNGAVAERMVVETTNGGAACAGPFSGSVLRDSVCIATGSGGAGVAANASDLTSTGSVRGVTAVGTGTGGSGIAILSGGSGPEELNLDVRNTIAIATPPASADIDLNGDGASSATIDLQYSNYDTVNSTGTTTFDPAGSPTNQTAAPVLAPTYRQLLTSPTRNAGSADSLSGALDVDGDPRIQESAIDIGADEFTPAVEPPDTTPPETTISKGPKKKSRKRKATFLFSADAAGATFTCKLDAKPAGPCTSPLKLKRLKKGEHTFSVVATDVAGNADASAATYKWKVKKRKKKG